MSVRGFSLVIFAAIVGIVCHAASIQKSNSFEIDVDTIPSDGAIQGLRIRRSGDLSQNIPEIDIEKIGDDIISVNGIRLKRSENLKDLSDIDLDEEASEDSEGSNDRSRRSGGGDLLGFIGQKLGQKISSFASASSGHNSESDLHYGTPVTSYSTKTFDFWAFKKAIVATLLQAAKAIKGGVIALGGQLVKAKGHLIAAKGKVLATKGDSITELGRDIAAKALLSSPSSHGSGVTAYATAAVDHVPETGFSTSGLGSGYPGPTQAGYVGVSTGYGVPTQHGYKKRGAVGQQFPVPHELPSAVQAGLLLLKPINVPDENVSYAKRKSS
ncbi:hypothetical protein RUM43_001532 [Polyplax serrata]|uniref:Uncharacterized protein n=1 Tax=Polyplax serrata TaxID=468196 RepID=A0AAN8SI83_POLSC